MVSFISFYYNKMNYVDENSAYYLLESYRNKFYISHKKFNDHDIVHIGAKAKCVTFSYDKHEKEWTILSTGYDQYCTLDGAMARGDDGTVNMMKCGFTFLKSKYPRAKDEIVFSDESDISCMDGKKMKLPFYYLGVYGKTWYETKFKASVHDKYVHEYNESKEKLQSLLKTIPDYEYIMRYAHSSLQKEFVRLYEQSNSLGQFIREVKGDYDCAAFREWLPFMISNLFPSLPMYTWKIKMSENTTPVNITTLKKKPEGIQFGGKFNTL